MTLADLLTDNWSLFMHPQTWYMDEPFLTRDEPVTDTSVPRGFVPFPDWEPGDDRCEPAVATAARYCAHPHDPYWHKRNEHGEEREFPTCDVDSRGRPVYLMVTARGLEVHRLLTLRNLGQPAW